VREDREEDKERNREKEKEKARRKRRRGGIQGEWEYGRIFDFLHVRVCV